MPTAPAPSTILDAAFRGRIVPVVTLDRAEDGPFLAEALLQGGLQVIEITLRTPAALPGIEAIARRFPDLAVGAGTVLQPQQVRQAQAAGARFGLAPGLDEAVLRAAADLADLGEPFPFVPGIATPSELQAAIRLGAFCVKLFPAEALGGPDYLKQMAGPFAHLPLRFNPTGGITEKTMVPWLALPAVAAVGGSWLAPRDMMKRGDWRGITDIAARTLKTLKQMQL